MHFFQLCDSKERTRYLHQILASIDPADAGCWMRFKLQTSWLVAVRLYTHDESDQEDDDMEDAEKQRHIDSQRDYGQTAGN